jgi:YVTN family beta-propeller protein/autotransporter-associated beta strand protein
MQIRTHRKDTRWQRVKRVMWWAIAVAGVLIPSAARAQVTAYAVIPSWTQSKVLVRDAHTGAAVASIPLTGEPYDAAITPDGRRAYVTQRASHQVAIIDLVTLQVVTTIAVGLEPRGVAITADGTRAWITEASSHTVSAIDVSTNAVIGAPIPVGQMPWGIALRPQGDRAYVVNRASSTVSALDLATQTVIAVMPVDQEPVEIIIAPDGRMAYVTSTIADTVVPIDLDTHTVQPSIPVGLFPRDLAITPDGTQIFVADSDSGTVSVIETATQSVIDTIPFGNVVPSGVTITPDGRHVLVGTQAFNLCVIIDANTHTLLSAIPVGGQALRVTSTPSMIVPAPIALSIANDADLTPFGFGGHITFRGGVLRATHDIFTSRHVSLLSQGGTIDTQQFAVEIAGTTVNNGILTKRGPGTLTLSGNSAHQSTHVLQGTLAVLGDHIGTVRVGRAATLAGTGTVAFVDASLGTISPGVNAPGELHAGDVLMSPSHTLVVEINGVKPGSQYDWLVATGSVSLNGANLALVPGGPMPTGAKFTIVTNANGTFAGLPDGAIIVTAFGKFRISYTGGPTQTDVVLTAL